MINKQLFISIISIVLFIPSLYSMNNDKKNSNITKNYKTNFETSLAIPKTPEWLHNLCQDPSQAKHKTVPQLQEGIVEKKKKQIESGVKYAVKTAKKFAIDLGLPKYFDPRITELFHTVKELNNAEEKAKLHEAIDVKKELKMLEKQYNFVFTEEDVNSPIVAKTYNPFRNKNTVYVNGRLFNLPQSQRKQLMQDFVSFPNKTALHEVTKSGLIFGGGFASKYAYNRLVKPQTKPFFKSLFYKFNRFLEKPVTRRSKLLGAAAGIGGTGLIVLSEMGAPWILGTKPGRVAGNTAHKRVFNEKNKD